MAYEDNITNACGDKEYIPSLNDLTGPIATCDKYIQAAAESIVNLLHTPGSKEEAYRSLLFARADILKRIAVIYEFTSGQLTNAAKKLADGIPVEEALADVLMCKISLNDQLKREMDGFKHVLNVIRQDLQDSVGTQIVNK